MVPHQNIQIFSVQQMGPLVNNIASDFVYIAFCDDLSVNTLYM